MPTDYTLTDATLEISLMLLAAFCLGWLLFWVLKKIFSKSEPDTSTYDFEDNTTESYEHSGLSTTSQDRLDITDYDDIPTIESKKIDTNTAASSINMENNLDTRTNEYDSTTMNKNVATAASIGAIGAVAAGAASLKDTGIDHLNNIDLSGVSDALDSGKDLLTEQQETLTDGMDSLVDIDFTDIKDTLKSAAGDHSSDLDTATDLSLDAMTIDATSIKEDALDDLSSIDLPDASDTVDSGKDFITDKQEALSDGLDALLDTTSTAQDTVAESDIPEMDFISFTEVGLTDIKETLDSDMSDHSANLDVVTDISLDSMTADAASLKENVLDDLSSVDLPDVSGVVDPSKNLIADKQAALSDDLDALLDTISTTQDTVAESDIPEMDFISFTDVGLTDIKETLDSDISDHSADLDAVTDISLDTMTADAASLKENTLDDLSSFDLPDVSGVVDSGKDFIADKQDTLSDGLDALLDTTSTAQDTVAESDIPEMDFISFTDVGLTDIKETLDSDMSDPSADLNAVTDISLDTMTADAASLKESTLDDLSSFDLPDVSGVVDSGKDFIADKQDTLSDGLDALLDTTSTAQEVVAESDIPEMDFISFTDIGLTDIKETLDSDLDEKSND